jgi:hypothetical protein
MLFTVFTVLELHAQSAAAAKLKSGRILVVFVFAVASTIAEAYEVFFNITTVDGDIMMIIIIDNIAKTERT